MHIIHRNLVKYACKLSDKGKYSYIKKNLLMIGDLVCEEDFFRVLDLFHIKYGDEKEFLDTF